MDLHAIFTRALAEALRYIGGSVPHEQHVARALVPAAAFPRLRHELQSMLGPSWHVFALSTADQRIDVDHEGLLVATLRPRPEASDSGEDAVSLRIEYYV